MRRADQGGITVVAQCHRLAEIVPRDGGAIGERRLCRGRIPDAAAAGEYIRHARLRQRAGSRVRRADERGIAVAAERHGRSRTGRLSPFRWERMLLERPCRADQGVGIGRAIASGRCGEGGADEDNAIRGRDTVVIDRDGDAEGGAVRWWDGGSGEQLRVDPLTGYGIPRVDPDLARRIGDVWRADDGEGLSLLTATAVPKLSFAAPFGSGIAWMDV